MLLGSVNWTTVLVAGVPAIISALLAGFASIIAVLNRQALRTPSGRSIGKQVESALHTGIANNMLLSTQNGPTKPLDPEAVSGGNAPAPQVPDESKAG